MWTVVSAGRCAWLSLAVGASVPAQGWMQRTPALAPPARGWNMLAYDFARGVSVMFGGWPGFLGDTWEWDGAAWSQRVPVNSPSGRCCGGFSYDLQRSRVVLFGGWGTTGDLGDTWEYDGANWIAMPGPGPQPRRSPGMCFEPVRSRTVLFGGGTDVSGSLAVFSDTWEWNGTVWTQLQVPNAPPARWACGMTTDVSRGRVLVHGGSNQNGSVPPTFADTWAFDGATWAPIAALSAPPPRLGFAMVYDWNDSQIVSYGGLPASNETWVLVGDTWVRDPSLAPMSPRVCVGLAYDVQRSRIVTFGGWPGVLDDTWEYVPTFAARWTATAPGCSGSAGVPILRRLAASRPRLGSTFQLELRNAPSPGPCGFAIGFSDQTWNGMALPLSMASFGMPGCVLAIRPEAVLLVASTNGQATLSWSLPVSPNLVGTRFFTQAIVLDPTANAFGAVLSNAGVGTAGRL